MRIKVNDIELDCWVEPYPIWFHITQDEKMVSFTHKDAVAIRDAMTSLIKSAYGNMDESHRHEVSLTPPHSSLGGV